MATSCKNCGCANQSCGCKDSYLTTPPPCPTPDDCPEAQPCSEVFDAQCIVYTGDDIVCDETTVVAQNTNVADALNQVVEYVCNQPVECCPTFVADIEPAGGLVEFGLTVNVTNGTAPFTYEWSYAQPSLGASSDFRGITFTGSTTSQVVSLTLSSKYYTGFNLAVEPSSKNIYSTHVKVRVTDANGQIADAYYIVTRVETAQ